MALDILNFILKMEDVISYNLPILILKVNSRKANKVYCFIVLAASIKYR